MVDTTNIHPSPSKPTPEPQLPTRFTHADQLELKKQFGDAAEFDGAGGLTVTVPEGYFQRRVKHGVADWADRALKVE